MSFILNYEKSSTEDLLAAYQEMSDYKAFDALVLKYSYLVSSICRYYVDNKSENLEDLFQVGCLGLIRAIKKFDINKGLSFTTYAVPNISGEIKKYFRDKSRLMKLSRETYENGKRIELVIDEYVEEHSRFPSIQEIAQIINVHPSTIRETIFANGASWNVVSLDTVPTGEDSREFYETLGVIEQGFIEVEKKILLKKLFAVLDPRESYVVHQVFFEGLSQSVVAKSLGISQIKVSQLQRRAIEKMQKACT